MRYTLQHVKQAMQLLGVWDDFNEMNRLGGNIEQVKNRFENFRKRVKRHYLAKAKECHPDKHQGSTVKMQELNMAYDCFKKLRIALPPPPVMHFQTLYRSSTNITISTMYGTSSSFWHGTGSF